MAVCGRVVMGGNFVKYEQSREMYHERSVQELFTGVNIVPGKARLVP